MSSTATVNIRVTDINDKNPEFVGLPYEFEVKEGEARKLIGHVHAEDADEGINAEVTYFAPDDVPFTVDPENGDVLTKIALDYEQNHVSLMPRYFANHKLYRHFATLIICNTYFICRINHM